MEKLWSECFQDLGSWCHQPQDELSMGNTLNQNEISFDDQSKYCKWDDYLSPSVEFKGDMWEQPTDLLSPPFPVEEDNNNLTEQISSNMGDKEAAITYSGNLLLTQCPPDYLSQDNRDIIDRTQTVQKFTTTHYQTYGIATKHQALLNRSTEHPIKTKQEAKDRPRPSLKLNISAANKACTSTSDTGAFSTMNTPDVFKSLCGDSDFCLLSFVNESSDENFLAVDPSSIVSQKPKESRTLSDEIAKIDHDYAETVPLDSSPPNYLVLGSMKMDEEPLPSIKEEEESKVFPIAVKEEPSSPVSVLTSLGKRTRRSTANSEDFVFDEDLPSDQSSDWSPVVAKKSKSSKKRSGGSKGTASKRVRTSSMSDSGSVTSGPDRYRELRDKNNEASRRSRMNRKQREVEMIDRATKLESANRQLKLKAAALERHVKEMRAIMLKVVLETKK